MQGLGDPCHPGGTPGKRRLPEWRQRTRRDSGRQRGAARRPRRPRPQGAEDVKERQEALSDDVDAILDEIDEVLEENAEEFVRSYVQKGGQ